MHYYSCLEVKSRDLEIPIHFELQVAKLLSTWPLKSFHTLSLDFLKFMKDKRFLNNNDLWIEQMHLKSEEWRK